MKISITSGKAEGPTKLNAFDNALLDAGIGNINLIRVSSIIPPDTKIIKLPKFKAGDMINCVLSCATSNRKGDRISAVVAIATSDDLGCVVEHSDVNKNLKLVEEEAIAMVKHMLDIRGKSIKNIITEGSSHIVRKQGAVVAAVVFVG